MKTFYINGRFLTQPVTGVQRFAIELLKSLDNILSTDLSDINFVLLIPKTNNKLPIFQNIKIKVIGMFDGHLWEQLDLPLYVKRNFLINLCNTAPISKKNQLIFIHDLAVYEVPQAYSAKFKLWYKFIFNVLARNGAKIATISQFSKSEIVKKFSLSPDSIFTIVEGAEHILNSPSDIGVFTKQNIGNRPYVLAVSSLTPNKNFNLVVKAIELIGDSGFDFVVAGGTDPKVFSASSEPLPGFVKYIGYVSDAELRALYEGAYCFVFPSFYEGFGLPPIEAMACNCPVLASNQASIPEICGDAALYFSPHNASDLKFRLLEIMNEPNKRDLLIRIGQERVLKYSWSIAGNLLLNYIKDIKHDI